MYTIVKVKCSIVQLLVYVCLVFSQAEDCGRIEHTQIALILGGTDAKPGEWPWHAAVNHLNQAGSKATYQCGGSLISSSFVITAAHCTYQNLIPLKHDLLSVRLGVTDLKFEGEGKEYRVNLVKRHPSYNEATHQYDVALLRTVTKVEFSEFIQPVCLPLGGNPQSFTEGSVVGWGIGDNNQMQSILQKAVLKRVDYATCLHSNPELYSVLLSKDNSNFCAGNGNMTNVCDGDSGGGMFSFNDVDQRWHLRGITNAGVRVNLTTNARCDPRLYVAFADVTYYLDWIESTKNMRKPNLFQLDDCAADDHEASVPEDDKPLFPQYPWVAILEYEIANSTKLETVCSGVLIHPVFVLTTGHCVCEACDGVKLKSVRLGDYDLSTNPDRDSDGEPFESISIPVGKTIPHPNFNLSGYEHNIGLIKLAREAPTRMFNIKPICLPSIKIVTENHFVVGWKRAGNSNLLERELVRLQDVDECRKLYSTIDVNLKPKESFMCAHSLFKTNECYSFKSASALFYKANLDDTNRYYLKGMYAFGKSKCGFNSYDVFVDTSYYSNWIKQTVDLEIGQ